MSSSPLVANFPTEFALVPLESFKNGGSFDPRSILEDNKVAIASLFGVISAILRQKIKEGEIEKYAWIVNVLNSVQIDSKPDKIQTASSRLNSLTEELNIVKLLTPEAKLKPKMVDKEDAKDGEVSKDVWTLINDVCNKFHVHLADLIAHQAQSSDVGHILSDIANRVTSKSSKS
ncbi:uncharacterized protein [Montipora foliosa]|uniref:uncharacterized protein n=1 Tax=Montipora foliosa TaxID=591990 RepID=UPI0035F11EFA